MSLHGGPLSCYRWLNTHAQMLQALKGHMYKWMTNCRVLHDERKTYVNDGFTSTQITVFPEVLRFLRNMKAQDVRVICFAVTAYLYSSVVGP